MVLGPLKMYVYKFCLSTPEYGNIGNRVLQISLIHWNESDHKVNYLVIEQP